ncbi:MAG: hypothetical protein GNW80_11955 [Asgard group archaeon]|nr:hypothetical protein [Asgard group archaeon]
MHRGFFYPFNPGANASGYVHTNATNIDSDDDTFIDSLEIILNTDPNDPLSVPLITPPPVTVTPPPEIITVPPETSTLNQTITVTTGIFIGTFVFIIATGLTVATLILRRKRK